MNKQDVNVLVMAGDGINCERETQLAFTQSGAKVDIVHVNDLMNAPEMLDNYDALAIPGGFSFGDELGSGQVLALKIRHGLLENFKKFVADKKPIIGICNGFQVLVKLGLISTSTEKRTLTLTNNEQGTFIDRWVDMNKHSKKCIWTQNLPETISLPIRHGEGRIVLDSTQEKEVYDDLVNQDQIVLSYTEDVNGSNARIAGLCDETGLIFGLMPHPEAYLFEVMKNPNQKDLKAKGIGQLIFENAVNHIRKEKTNVLPSH